MKDIVNDPFAEYMKQEDPDRIKLAHARYTGIGLQAVDRLETKENTYFRTISDSDSFPNGAKSDIDVQVKMLNVNFGNNQKLLNWGRTNFLTKCYCI